MDLKTFFQITKPAEREAIAKEANTTVNYLYLLTRDNDRQAGPDLCKRLVAADSRFTLAELRPDIWGNGIDSLAASDDVQPPVGGDKRKTKLAKAA